MAFYEVVVDGAARGIDEYSLGEGAAAVAIYRNKKLIGQYARGLGRVNNNQAEYEALLLGLIIAWAADLKNPVIYSDSTLVVNQVNGVWKCTQETLRPLLLSVWEIQDDFHFALQHVPRRYVSKADGLAKAFLDKLQNAREKKGL